MQIRQTPWGTVQHQEEIAPGIVRVMTAGHGGYILSQERLARMPQRFKLNTYGTGRYFEEDCEWALVVLAFPDDFTPDQCAAARDMARMVYPSLRETIEQKGA